MYNLVILCRFFCFKGKEWLCLNCQVKRAAGGIEPEKDTSAKKMSPAQSAQQKTSAPGSPQRKVSSPPAPTSKVEVIKGPDSVKQGSPAAQKTPSESLKTGPQNQPDQKSQATLKQGNAAAQQESAGFFGFGGSKSQTNAAKPTESVTGKMFGFGSSIFSSASTLISSSVQDEPKTTPPVSPKISAKDSKSPTAMKPDQEKKPDQPLQIKDSKSAQPKGDKPRSEPPRKASVIPVIPSADQPDCPLCKLKLNVGSKDPPNYNTCTMCKHIVCNQCGFNPLPNVTEVRKKAYQRLQKSNSVL